MMMTGSVKMGSVWDRTTEVLNGRSGMIATLTAIGLVLPSIVRDAYVSVATPGTISFAGIGMALSLAAVLAMIWAQLAIIAVATHPATTREDAGRQARVRLAPAFGLTLLVGLVAVVAMLPPIVALSLSGFDFAGAARGAGMATTVPSAGTALFVTIYCLVLGVLAIWAAARLILLNPVILNERRGIGAIRRSIALTRGRTWRIIGVVILFAIVLTVSTLAAQAVTGLIFRLVLGASAKGLATFLAGVVGTLVSSAFTAIAAVFTAQFYVATAGAPTSE